MVRNLNPPDAKSDADRDPDPDTTDANKYRDTYADSDANSRTDTEPAAGRIAQDDRILHSMGHIRP